MIRLAKQSDKELLLSLGRKFHAESQYNKIPFDAETVWDGIQTLIENGWLLTDGESGMIGFVIFHSFFNSKHLICQELYWYVEKDNRKSGVGVELLKKAESTAKNLGANMMIMLCLENNRIDELYQSLGYDKAETSFTRAL